jgi:hypothetical protein
VSIPQVEMPKAVRLSMAAFKNVPGNYDMRYSGVMTALTARRVRHGVGAGPSASRISARYKGVFVPRRFFNRALNPLLLFPSPARPLCLRPRRAPMSPRSSSGGPTGPTQRYDKASQNVLNMTTGLLFARVLSSTCSSAARLWVRPRG